MKFDLNTDRNSVMETPMVLGKNNLMEKEGDMSDNMGNKQGLSPIKAFDGWKGAEDPNNTK
jgi:hypothetical protein